MRHSSRHRSIEDEYEGAMAMQEDADRPLDYPSHDGVAPMVDADLSHLPSSS